MTKKKNYTIQFLIRLTPKEYELLRKNSAVAGLSMSEYTRKSLVGEKIVAAPPVDFDYFIREVKRVGSNLHQVLRKLNILGIAHPLELERCANEIHEVMDLIYQTYWPEKENKDGSDIDMGS